MVAAKGIPLLGTWRRHCALRPQARGRRLGLETEVDLSASGRRCFPNSVTQTSVTRRHDYTLTTLFPSGREVKTALLPKLGSDWGFVEARPYIVANNLSVPSAASGLRISECGNERASMHSLNSIVEGSIGSLRMTWYGHKGGAGLLQYTRSFRLRDLPSEHGEVEHAIRLFTMWRPCFSSSVIGVNRAHRIGLNSTDRGRL